MKQNSWNSSLKEKHANYFSSPDLQLNDKFGSK